MKRVLPPLRAVQYFERAAERESFTVAAEDLAVSKGSVSQQVRLLETYLGVRLFRKSGRKVALTDAGRRYHSAVRNALNILEAETERTDGARKRSTLRITALPAFASVWLVPRLDAFQKLYPHLDIEISADAEIVDFNRSDAQIGIRYGGPDLAGLERADLGKDTLFPVCSPSYRDAMDLRTPGDLNKCRLLHDTYWRADWTRWLAAASAAECAGRDSQFYTHYSMAIDAARAGSGVAMGHGMLIRDLLARGDLVSPFEQTIEAEAAYYAVIPERARHLDYVRRFRDWLLTAVAGSGTV
ncbi:MAG: LysR family transcriptional regulator [Alphaproteobacteria bacterium]|nr:LysR family transcriptional regulator [Alphaproteobacteria bacterium]